MQDGERVRPTVHELVVVLPQGQPKPLTLQAGEGDVLGECVGLGWWPRPHRQRICWGWQQGAAASLQDQEKWSVAGA